MRCVPVMRDACDAMTTRTHTKWREEGRGMQDVCTYDIQSAPEVM